MSTGFYKRRRGILEHLESGTIGLIDLAVHDYLCLKINSVRGNGCSIPAGVCFTSSAAIYSLCPREVSERTIRRSLEHLERIGWIKRWTVTGKHGNYPVLVARASVHDLSGNEYRVSAEKTIDWRLPVYVDGEDGASTRRGDVRLSRIENKEQRKTLSAKTTPPADPRFQPFVDFAYEAFEAKHGQKPTWTGKDFKALAAMLASNRSLDAAEMEKRFQNYLASTEAFTVKQGDSLAYFCAHPDSFLNGPIFEPRKVANGNQTSSDLAIQNARALGLGRPN